MEVSSQIAASLEQGRANVALAAIKQNAEADKQIADLLQSAAASVPGSPVRGLNVNVKV